MAEVRLTLGMPIIEWVGRDYPVGTKLYTAPAPAAQGGQQPAGVTFPMPDKPGLTMACFDAQTVPVRTPLYTAPAAPAAPLTTLPGRIEELIAEHGTLRAVARHLRVDPAYMHRLRRGEMENPGDDLLADMGLCRVVMYERINLAGTAQKGGE